MFYNYRPDGLSEKGMRENIIEQTIAEMEAEGDVVVVPRGLLGAAASAIDKQREAPRVLAVLRHYGTGSQTSSAKHIAACVTACSGFTTEELISHTGPRTLHTRLKEAFYRIDELLGERSQTGLAIDAAIRDGVVPEQHPLRSRLEMLANHRQHEQELAAQLKDATRQCGVMVDALRYLREFVTTNVWDDEERSLLLEIIDSATASTKAE